MPMTQNYDTGVDVRNEREAVQQDMGQQNPLMDALQTLNTYVVSQREQGNEQLVSAYIQFLNALRGAGEQGQPIPEQQRAFDPFQAPEEKAPVQRRPEATTPTGQRAEMGGRGRVMGL